MNLGIVEDYTTQNVYLDEKLTEGKVVLNRATDPLITLRNLLAFLPKTDITHAEWVSGSYDLGSIVSYNDELWECVLSTTSTPSNPDWIKTSIESLRIREFLERVKERVNSELFSKRLIRKERVIDRGLRESKVLGKDYHCWSIEPKGYVSIRLNKVSIESDEPSIDLYLLDGNRLADTISVTPTSSVDFQDVNYTYRGDDIFRIAIDSTTVKRGKSLVSKIFLDEFDVWLQDGTGDDVSNVSWSNTVFGNGVSLDFSVLLDLEKYIDSNEDEFSYYLRTTFEYMCFELFLTNPNVRLNGEDLRMDRQYLLNEIKTFQGDTVAYRRKKEKDRLMKLLSSLNIKTYSSDNFYNLGTV